MEKKRKAPQLRFKGFEEEWEEKKLGSVAEINPKSDVPQFFEYVDLESVVGTELISHRQESKFSAPSRAQRLAKKGDLFYQTVRPYQKNNYLFKKSYDNYVFSTGYAQLRPSCDSDFLLCLVQTDSFVKLVLDRCTGTSYPAINSNDLADIKTSFCHMIKEQSKIGTFFQHLDALMALRRRKLDKLTTVKKAMLEKMFPKEGADAPEIRFKGFTGKWERKKLGEEKDVRDGTHDSPKYCLTGHPLVTSKNLSDSGLDLTDVSFISDYDFREINKRSKVDIGDIIFGMIGTIGNPVIVDRDDIAIKNVALIKNNKTLVNDFLIFLLKSSIFSDYIKSEYSGSTQSFLSLNKIRDFQFLAPNQLEQSAISSFFQHLDSLIALQGRELDKLKQIKKACLEKMFI